MTGLEKDQKSITREDSTFIVTFEKKRSWAMSQGMQWPLELRTGL